MTDCTRLKAIAPTRHGEGNAELRNTTIPIIPPE